ILFAGILARCVDCNQRWHHHCRTKFTGYYCAGNRSIVSKEYLTNSAYATSTSDPILPFDVCTPYPYVLHYAETYCCMYSPNLGCHVALHPHVYKYEKHPGIYCDECKQHCICDEFGAAPRLGSWAAVRLFGIVALLRTFVSSLLEPVCSPGLC
ncbi:hypothetical protein KR074_005889, partial [Drosophila pseudoananassae]